LSNVVPFGSKERNSGFLANRNSEKFLLRHKEVIVFSIFTAGFAKASVGIRTGAFSGILGVTTMNRVLDSHFSN